MEALLVGIVLVLLALLVAGSTTKNEQLEAEIEAYRRIIASMQREEDERANGDSIGIGLLVLGVLLVLALLATA